jgi:hypothetical protein
MAFKMEAQLPVECGLVDSEKYISKVSEEQWGVVVPLSLKGGGSIHLGMYKSKDAAKKAVEDYVEGLRCTGCRDGMANQEAHYGGCMSDPDGEG